MDNTKHSPRPDETTLIRAYVESTQGTITATHTAVFEYPECIRTFDGDIWKAFPKSGAIKTADFSEQTLKDYLIGKGVIK